MLENRESGVLLHPVSLPAKHGIGDFGKEAYKFIDFLAASSQKLWQILPLNPPGFGDSPYQSSSVFAGNSLLISLDKLVATGLLTAQEIEEVPPFAETVVQYDEVKKYKDALLRKACKRFMRRGLTADFDSFIKTNDLWLENYSLYMAVKGYFGGLSWNRWEKQIAFRDEKAIKSYNSLLKEEIEYYKFLQFIFYRQWLELKHYANSKQIKIIGDLPIYVSYDSSDVWSNRELFELDSIGNPRVVAGVPPDYFSKTGQLWGNPIYKWENMKKDDYRWWRERFKNALYLADIIRIDHFRGFAAYWQILATEENAINGKWIRGPGEHFFLTIKSYLGDLNLIAEDLGVITEDVKKLRKTLGFPGMQVLQFALEEAAEKSLPEIVVAENTAFYTGTHDNNTILGWFREQVMAKTVTAEWLQNYLAAKNEEEICWWFIELVFKSKAKMAIVPLQDMLCLGEMPG